MRERRRVCAGASQVIGVSDNIGDADSARGHCGQCRRAMLLLPFERGTTPLAPHPITFARVAMPSALLPIPRHDADGRLRVVGDCLRVVVTHLGDSLDRRRADCDCSGVVGGICRRRAEQGCHWWRSSRRTCRWSSCWCKPIAHLRKLAGRRATSRLLPGYGQFVALSVRLGDAQSRLRGQSGGLGVGGDDSCNVTDDLNGR